MKEIEFRGKQMDNGVWVHGYYRETEGFNGESLHLIHCIELSECEDYSVDPDTVGQYIGLKGTTNREFKAIKDIKIYEHDICRITQACGEEIIGEVVWDADYLRYALDIGYDLWDFANIIECKHIITVIGNIHDNPGLLTA